MAQLPGLNLPSTIMIKFPILAENETHFRAVINIPNPENDELFSLVDK